MFREKNDNASNIANLSGEVMAYPDGSISVSEEAIRRQYLEQFNKASARSNVEEEKRRERLEE